MKIFKQELDDGLEQILSTTASICYASEALPSINYSKHNIENIKSLAALNDSDLYYVQSILVSSSWNKNDDIFDKAEVWKARNTPEDKPTNLEHNEAVIIGHITSNWPITEDGNFINENIDINDLPEKYHILTGSVIYKAFSNDDLKKRSEKLISEIENGTKYVSMECFFKGFDYGLINKTNGAYKILTRNENTAYLTKYLRAYGGQGEHDNYKIGRVLRDITFSGKGFVDKPANPDSIIFTKNAFVQSNAKKSTENFEDLSIAGVFDNQSNLNVENNIMNLETIQAEVSDLKNRMESVAGCSEVVKEAYSLASTLKDKVSALETELTAKIQTIAELTSAQEAFLTEKEVAAKKKQDEDTEKEEKMKKVESELQQALETISAYKTKEEEMDKKEKKMKRSSALIQAGFDHDTVTATVDKFENLDDEAFAAITSLFAAKKAKDEADEEDMQKEKAGSKKDKAMTEDDEADLKKKSSKEKATTKKTEEDDEEEDKKDKVDASVLETAELTSQFNLGVGGESNSTIETTRAELVEFVSSRLGKKH